MQRGKEKEMSNRGISKGPKLRMNVTLQVQTMAVGVQTQISTHSQTWHQDTKQTHLNKKQVAINQCN